MSSVTLLLFQIIFNYAVFEIWGKTFPNDELLIRLKNYFIHSRTIEDKKANTISYYPTKRIYQFLHSLYIAVIKK